MAEVSFCRENILAHSPGKKLYLAWSMEIPYFPPKAGVERAMGSFYNQVTSSHGDDHLVRTVHHEVAFGSIGPNKLVSWLVAIEWNA